jgi:GNAT superfamily N-acetyltransferase
MASVAWVHSGFTRRDLAGNFIRMGKIEHFRIGEEWQVSRLIHSVFDEFIAPENEDRGNEYFIDFIRPENIRQRAEEHTDVIYTYKIGRKIVGVISVKEKSHISLLFVDGEHHNSGIARNLLQEYIARHKPSGITELTVNASPFSVGIYERLGFSRESALLELNGIRFIRMRRTI